MDSINAKLYEYNTITNDRLFGINGVLNTSLSQEYLEASEQFTNFFNKISYSPVPKYINSYSYLYKVNFNKNTSIEYQYIKVDDNYNKLDINKLDYFILNKYVLAEILVPNNKIDKIYLNNYKLL